MTRMALGVGKRMRRRRLQRLRTRRALETESASSHDAHLRLLAELCGKLECGHFDAEEILEARASLVDGCPTSRQALLPLRRRQHA